MHKEGLDWLRRGYVHAIPDPERRVNVPPRRGPQTMVARATPTYRPYSCSAPRRLVRSPSRAIGGAPTQLPPCRCCILVKSQASRLCVTGRFQADLRFRRIRGSESRLVSGAVFKTVVTSEGVGWVRFPHIPAITSTRVSHFAIAKLRKGRVAAPLVYLLTLQIVEA